MRPELASPLLDAAIRGVVVLLAALVLTVLLRRRSAAARHAVWAGAITAQLVLLALAVWGPRWRIVAPEAVSALLPARVESPEAPPAPVTDVRVSAADAPRDVASAPRTDSIATAAAAPAAERPAAPRPAPTAPRRPIPLATIVLAIWAIGAAVVLLRLAAGTVTVSRLARRGRRVDDGGWLSLTQRLAMTLGIDRPLTLLRGDRLGVPVTWGVVYPIVLLPEDADAWPEDRRRYVLVHEMAHVKRLDALTQLVAQIALALFWFDPLMWIAVRRLQLEREHACDDYVLRHGTQPSRYAEDLLAMVRTLGTPEHRAAQPAFAALAMARRTEFEGRMLSILDPVLDRHPLHRGRTLMGALASLLIIVPLAALQPYRPGTASQSASAAPSTPQPTSTSSSTSRNSEDGRDAARPDAPLSERLESLDSARSSTATRLRAFDSSTARVVGPGGVATVSSSTSASHQTNTSSSTNDASPTGHDDSCDRYRPGNSSQTQFHMHADDDERDQTIRYLDFNAQRCVQADIRGKILVDDNEDHILAIRPEATGRAYFRERTASIDRELTVTFGQAKLPESYARMGMTHAAGNVFLYRVNGTERPYDDEGRRWFADLLPRVLAEAAINVKPRVARWRSQGGNDNALRHIGELRSSGAKRAHYDALLDTQLSAGELDRTVKQAGRDIPSSGDLRAVLSKAAQQTRTTKVPSSTLEEAIGAVPSSGDLTAVLLAFAQTDDREQLLAIARTALRIPSSGDLSRFLIDAAPKYLARDDARLRDAYFTAVGKIPSSGDLSRVLVNAVVYAEKSADVARAIIAGAREVPSSGDRSRVLVALASSGVVKGGALRDAYLKATSEIPASDDMRRALEALAAAGN